MDCSTPQMSSRFIQSEETYDFVVTEDELNNLQQRPDCTQPINEQYQVVYYSRRNLPPLSIGQYSYSAIPKCFWLMDSTALDVSGILRLQNQPGLSLKGSGVLMGIVDTGIDYSNPLFRDEAGNSRILSIWDQTGDAATGIPPEGFLYGVEYTREAINQALATENPEELIPTADTEGHGTFLASVAAGGADEENDFVGGAPLSELVIVKLKPAKQNLRDFFYFPREELLYQENDIMTGIAYLDMIAKRENRPLVILLGVGSNQGSHVGSDPLSEYLNTIGSARGRAVVVPSGNQAVARQHFYGRATNPLVPVRAEINVPDGVEGLCMELWAYAPEQVRVVLQSPTGQLSQGGFPISEDTQTTEYIFENTVVTINYRVAGRRRGDLLAFIRFTRPSEGIWTLLVYPQNSITGDFHVWLPIRVATNVAQEREVVFVRPDPDTTLTTPSAASIPITVGGYDALPGAMYIPSGRGYDPLGRVKPELCAPAVNVAGAGLRENHVTYTGTSAAAAVTAGATAQALEWGINLGIAPGMNSVEVKNLLIRGSNREENIVYPNPEWGYGKLDIYQSFEQLRE